MKAPAPPKARKEDHFSTIHGIKRNDPYHWLRLSDEQKNAENPDERTQAVVDFLNEENSYLKNMLGNTESLQDELYNEMVGRIKQDDSSVPYKLNGYYYLRSFSKGNEYPVYSRRKEKLDAADEIILNVEERAKSHDFYQVSSLSVSPDNKILAFGEDTLSRRIYKIRFKSLETGEMLEDSIENTTGHAVWANDNKCIFYSVKDESLRSFKIFRHVLGSKQEEDTEIYHEADNTFRTFVYKSKSRKYLIIGSASTLSTEYRYLDADDPFGSFKIFHPREKKHEYSIAHFEDKWFIRTNKDAVNFKVMECPVENTAFSNWKNFIEHRQDVLIESFDLFQMYFVVNERIGGILQIRIINSNGEAHQIELPEENHLVYFGMNPEFDSNILRIQYSSMITPLSVFDYNMDNREMKLMKQQEVLGGFDSNDYTTQRLNVEARDGAMVPLSLVYRKDTQLTTETPLLLYAYGSYGISMDPYFSSVRLSLLDRGFVFAIAHIRGGEELGRQWYLDGKLLNKKNTFFDFIDCAEYLISANYTSSEKLFAMGGSAGGLLMGAVLNLRPDLWKGVIAAVPFVDVINTMLDESIPLTTGEYDEWGNPNEEEYFHYINSYSPYDNVEEKDYPAILVTTGYFDSQVQYWEPAKWVARLRELKTNDKPLLLFCDMETGHGGKSGRFKRLKDTALEYAFLLWMAGKS